MRVWIADELQCRAQARLRGLSSPDSQEILSKSLSLAPSYSLAPSLPRSLSLSALTLCVSLRLLVHRFVLRPTISKS